ncbi:MAG: helix-turn-helix domain-containing protein [Ruminococcus sp.]|nr:helix-turn-helix domain-containing protein [Ruminococcus sp.]
MDIYERIKELRKQHLKLSQEQFGKMLGVNRDVINNIERNRLAKPEQKEPLYRLICETFRVNYKWLTSGDGEMFVTTKQSFVEKLAEEYGLSYTAQKIIESYLNLDEQQRATVDDFIRAIAESIVESPPNSDNAGAVDEALDKAMSIYRAAYSKEHTEHEIIKDGKETIDKLSQIPPVTDKEDF